MVVVATLGKSDGVHAELLAEVPSESAHVVTGEFNEIPIRVFNNGRHRASSIDVESSCACVAAKFTCDSLDPRASGTLLVKVRSPFTEPFASGNVYRNAIVRIGYDDGEHGDRIDLNIPLKLSLRSPVSVGGGHVIYLRDMPEYGTDIHYEMQIEADPAVTILSVASSNPVLEVKLSEADADGLATLAASVRDQQLVCRLPFLSLQIQMQLLGSNGPFRVVLPVYSSVIRNLNFTPPAVILGPAEPGVMVSKKVRVSSPTGKIQSLEIGELDPGIFVNGLMYKDGNCEFEFPFNSVALGLRSSHPKVIATVVRRGVDGQDVTQVVESSTTVLCIVRARRPN